MLTHGREQELRQPMDASKISVNSRTWARALSTHGCEQELRQPYIHYLWLYSDNTAKKGVLFDES